jgi:hypothetical protein
VYLGWPDDGAPAPTPRRSLEEVSAWLGWEG